MNSQEDQAWKALLLSSRPTFAGEAAPPFGFIASTVARIRTEQGQEREFERIGWRALFASLATLVMVAGTTVFVQAQERNELEPGVRSMVEIENVPLS